jgi:four helix bundle protein
MDQQPERVMVRNYRDLTVWQRAMELVKEVYIVTGEFPSSEKFGLVSQLRRAAVSIPSNIAEGQGRRSRGEFVQFLGHARGSLFEVETQLLIAAQLGFLSDEKSNELQQRVNEVARLMNGLMKSLQSK